ncbi:unnamed protein product [Vitrella brassicaformis CCMP3155]|uniref:non-specific serine/threonine protein kinase n=3 Tax=Vitrella brassicaformis TaxID=1169539 RepID=A0A0G4EZZ2_VITBC|nr:unnamed protein product [Vitrella brassicaformis CCMP3155]|eukprot:CEM05207.1 unnamed protein product [Vitrella brassicaformis CCMP3155]
MDSFEAYELVREIARGASGRVLLVRHKASQREYVMKSLDITSASSADKDAALHEAQTISRLQHAHVVRYASSFIHQTSDGTFLVIVTEYAERGDLAAEIAERRRDKRAFTYEEALDIFAQIVLAIEYIHDEKHMIHRDVTAGNVLLTANMRVKLGDFGLCRQLNSTKRNGRLQGTPSYLAPELFRNEAHSTKSDIWALGCLLHFLLTLEHPFATNNIGAAVRRIAMMDPPSLPANYNPALVSLVTSMLADNPAERPEARDILRLDVMKAVLRRLAVTHTAEGHYVDALIRASRAVDRAPKPSEPLIVSATAPVPVTVTDASSPVARRAMKTHPLNAASREDAKKPSRQGTDPLLRIAEELNAIEADDTEGGADPQIASLSASQLRESTDPEVREAGEGPRRILPKGASSPAVGHGVPEMSPVHGEEDGEGSVSGLSSGSFSRKSSLQERRDEFKMRKAHLMDQQSADGLLPHLRGVSEKIHKLVEDYESRRIPSPLRPRPVPPKPHPAPPPPPPPPDSHKATTKKGATQGRAVTRSNAAGKARQPPSLKLNLDGLERSSTLSSLPQATDPSTVRPSTAKPKGMSPCVSLDEPVMSARSVADKQQAKRWDGGRKASMGAARQSSAAKDESLLSAPSRRLERRKGPEPQKQRDDLKREKERQQRQHEKEFKANLVKAKSRIDRTRGPFSRPAGPPIRGSSTLEVVNEEEQVEVDDYLDASSDRGSAFATPQNGGSHPPPTQPDSSSPSVPSHATPVPSAPSVVSESPVKSPSSKRERASLLSQRHGLFQRHVQEQGWDKRQRNGTGGDQPIEIFVPGYGRVPDGMADQIEDIGKSPTTNSLTESGESPSEASARVVERRTDLHTRMATDPAFVSTAADGASSPLGGSCPPDSPPPSLSTFPPSVPPVSPPRDYPPPFRILSHRQRQVPRRSMSQRLPPLEHFPLPVAVAKRSLSSVEGNDERSIYVCGEVFFKKPPPPPAHAAVPPLPVGREGLNVRQNLGGRMKDILIPDRKLVPQGPARILSPILASKEPPGPSDPSASSAVGERAVAASHRLVHRGRSGGQQRTESTPDEPVSIKSGLKMGLANLSFGRQSDDLSRSDTFALSHTSIPGASIGTRERARGSGLSGLGSRHRIPPLSRRPEPPHPDGLLSDASAFQSEAFRRRNERQPSIEELGGGSRDPLLQIPSETTLNRLSDRIMQRQEELQRQIVRRRRDVALPPSDTPEPDDRFEHPPARLPRPHPHSHPRADRAQVDDERADRERETVERLGRARRTQMGNRIEHSRDRLQNALGRDSFRILYDMLSDATEEGELDKTIALIKQNAPDPLIQDAIPELVKLIHLERQYFGMG